MDLERHALLKELIVQQQLTPLFQPIVDNTGNTVIGYEALIRGPKAHPLEFPDQLFATAQEFDLLSELELACREAAIQAFLKLETDARLFLNVNPNVLQDGNHPHGTTLRLSEHYGLNPERIVIELSERYPIQQPDLLKEAVKHYQQLGFLVAIDDLGAGYSGLKLWSEIKPDFVKIDRYFITNIQNDPTKREFVQSIVALARNLNAKVIAEGIECQPELEQLQLLNLALHQGFYIGMPSSEPKLTDEYQEYSQKKTIVSYSPSTERIANVTRETMILTSMDKAHQALEIFSSNRRLSSLPVVDNAIPVGMLRRESMMELFSGSYGRALYANKDVARIMDRNPMIVDLQTPIEQVSNIITDDHDVDVFREFIVTRQGQYYGIASVRDLLKHITDARVQNARYANPLTLLPGNVPIHQTLDRLLLSHTPLAVAYFDLNHFKPFNDNYGYSQGDQVIQFLGQLLRKHVQSIGEFVGHIGGDDFVAVFENLHAVSSACQAIVDDFENALASFLTTKDIARGYIQATGRDGKDARFPLLSLAVGIVRVETSKFYSHHDVATLATIAKKQAKSRDGSYCHIDYH